MMSDTKQDELKRNTSKTEALIQSLEACIADPMWPAHAEVSKFLLKACRDRLKQYANSGAAPQTGAEPAAWMWEYIGPDPMASQIHPCARALHELNPHDNPYPTHWKPVAPLYTHPMRELSDAEIRGNAFKEAAEIVRRICKNWSVDVDDVLVTELEDSILEAARKP
jgi:hypothetical protein